MTQNRSLSVGCYQWQRYTRAEDSWKIHRPGSALPIRLPRWRRHWLLVICQRSIHHIHVSSSSSPTSYTTMRTAKKVWEKKKLRVIISRTTIKAHRSTVQYYYGTSVKHQSLNLALATVVGPLVVVHKCSNFTINLTLMWTLLTTDTINSTK